MANTISKPTDQDTRIAALHPAQSFIVQAPAGSGKTELLMQRYLTLLAKACKAPEEILAITFTRKAAAEMRTRVINTLKKGNTQLAQAVMLRDKTEEWQLLANPNRLRIMTIDSLCASLVRQMPLLSQSTPHASLTQDPTLFYHLAARELLQGISENKPWTEALSHVLLHLDNDMHRLEGLLVAMLVRRDQWLPHLMHSYNMSPTQRNTLLRNQLEDGLRAVLMDKIQSHHQHFPHHLQSEMETMSAFAGYDSKTNDPKALKALTNFYLTTTGTVRKTITQAQGFPAPSNAKDKATHEHLKLMKQRMLDLLKSLEGETVFVNSLFELMQAPLPSYSNAQWQVLSALLTLLPLLAAHLTVIFNAHNTTDFSAVTQAAIAALGTPERPTDLALHLDYQTQHLLVDEFQDTSFTQYRLLEQLIAGWLPDDGHTLFLVGDPMQSIYRFRQAEVGLFLHVQKHGIAQLRPTVLSLSVNFRSTAPLMDCINTIFQPLFPEKNTIDAGAIAYTPSVAFDSIMQTETATHKTVHYHATESAQEQGLRIARLIHEALLKKPSTKIAVLVHSRTHLAPLLPILQSAGIDYHGVDIEPLKEYTVIQDLYSLTRALLHLGDRLAWLAILRAPWCGLTLADLHALASGRYSKAIVWECLTRIFHEIPLREDEKACGDKAQINKHSMPEKPTLSPQGVKQLNRVIPILHHTLINRHRLPLADEVQGCWEALGGPACIHSEADLDRASAYFNLLRTLTENNTTVDLDYLETQLATLYAAPNPHANPNVQIMTLHKAKGLEFDIVLLPALERTSKYDAQPLLRWTERTRHNQQTDLLLAPITKIGQTEDPIYRYLAHLETTRAKHEATRLLYVATTRARHCLHLIGTLPSTIMDDSDDSKGATSPPKHSLLEKLWPTTRLAFIKALATQKIEQEEDQRWAAHYGIKTTSSVQQASHSWLTQLSASWQLPSTQAGFAQKDKRQGKIEKLSPPHPSITTSQKNVNDQLMALQPPTADSSTISQHIGIVIHTELQHISQQGIATWQSAITITQRIVHWRSQFEALGFTSEETISASSIVEQAMTKTLSDTRGCWILDPHHQAAQSEYSIKTLDANGEIIHLIIDRTFIDQKGIRWIIDYKISPPPPRKEDLDNFLTMAARKHQAQLQQYATAMVALDKGKYHSIKLALYFPRFAGWREIKIPTRKVPVASHGV